jgi:hypothetical protein
MGFYDRQNIGDDTFKIVIPALLPSCDVVCVSCDDVENSEHITDEYDVVLIGGGDLVNDYFMQKMQQLLKTYNGRIYGVSLGIPFSSCSHYLHIFDHVVVRSREDFLLACEEIGEVNVTQLPDFSVALCNIDHGSSLEDGQPPVDAKDDNVITVGVCLAQPLFYNNPKRSNLIESLCQSLLSFAKQYSQFGQTHVRFILLAFNSNTLNNQECDYIVNTQVAKRLSKLQVDAVLRHDITSPQDMLEFFKNNLDLCICMRYHSVMFSVIANIPFVPLYVSQKIQNLLADIGYSEEIACRLQFDAKYRPTQIDGDKLYTSLSTILTMNKPYNSINIQQTTQQITQELEDLVITKRPYAARLSIIKATTFSDVLTRCKVSLCKYLGIEPHNFESLLYSVGALQHKVKSSLDIARFLCFNITGQMNHPCVWGLADNLQRPYFKLYDAIKYIYDEISTSNKTRGKIYYPSITNLNRRVLINVDFVFSNDFTKYHRSGWSYVVGGLMNLDAPTMLKQSDVLVDTYVDRTFHWGRDIMKTLGEIPYTKPWYGFIHHTFDTNHSGNNCHVLFEQEDFITSLSTCKGLIVLTKYLQQQIEQALFEKHILDVPVFILYHPMEFVDNMFTMQKFASNSNKKVVQIGAWLRNPYAIYQMVLPSNTDMTITKAHLRGTEMDLYFAPINFLDVVSQALCINNSMYLPETSTICRSEDICRPNSTYPTNKYSQGALQLLTSNHNSVTVLDKLSNKDYDDLMSENIIFLNLVDCSAVNTVIECIVRNTPLVVNRHPALEEILGQDYPGFYSTLDEAGALCASLSSIEKMHIHMRLLDKTRYTLENFITDFQEIVADGGVSRSYILKQQNIQNAILPIRQFQNIYRFLPARYQLST